MSEDYDTSSAALSKEEKGVWFAHRPRELSSSISLDGRLTPIQETRQHYVNIPKQIDAKKHKSRKHPKSSFDFPSDHGHRQHLKHDHHHKQNHHNRSRHGHRYHHHRHRRSKSLDSGVFIISDGNAPLKRVRHHARKKSLDKEAVTSFNTITSHDSSEEENASNDNGNNGQEQIRDLDEAFRLYYLAEKAARKIQLAFRETHPATRDKADNSDSSTENDSHGDKDAGSVNSDEDDTQPYTLIFLALFTLVTVGPRMLTTCWSMIKRMFGGDDSGGVDAIANQTIPQGGGGAAPSGGEAGATGGAQAGAQGAMVAQAASSAATGAASGVSAGAAAGAAASSAAAAATAGAAAAAAGATQVATVVAVSTAAVAATTAGIRAVTNTTPEPILSTCGLVNPDIRSGRFVMLFEGFPRPLDDRESGLVEDLVLDSYNEITLGSNVAAVGCLDPLAREMQNVSIVNQTLSAGINELEPALLEVIFESTVSCDRCPATSPLFSEQQTEKGGESYDASTEKSTENDMVEVKQERDRNLASFDFSSQKFFQKLIQLVIFETEELTDAGELPPGFVQISKALVITNEENEDEVLVTQVKYKRSSGSGGANVDSGPKHAGEGDDGIGIGSKVLATFEFEYVDSSGQVQKETIDIREDGGSIPTTSFPTFQPSHAPTDNPSMEPTHVFSGAPSSVPSVQPSNSPSDTPTQSPSDVPSVSPSESPSCKPSKFPSEEPSPAPSMAPSVVPSTLPSMVPSTVPSTIPSAVPSTIPSTSPSLIPSFAPSEVPSSSPSSIPSAIPSSNPSLTPSSGPTPAPTPSPSAFPTAAYVGCYMDTLTRDFDILYILSPMSVAGCRAFCQSNNLLYAGLQVGSECWCGNSYGRFGTATNCGQFLCDGLLCGGDWANAVYVSGL